MPHPYDATLKDLVQTLPADFADPFGFGGVAPLAPLNVDLSSLTAATDVGLGRGDPPELVIDLNFQSSWADDLVPRVLLYSAAYHLRFRVPVHSVIVLLRPKADHPDLIGKLHYQALSRRSKLAFDYEIVRLWKVPVAKVLSGGLGALALAPLCRMPGDAPLQDALPRVLETLIQRLNREAAPDLAAKIVTGAYVLSGLRMTRDEARQLFGRVRAVEESTTYQGILEEGAVRGLHRALLNQGRIRFGKASADIQTAIASIEDLERLHRMMERVVTVTSWKKLLATR